MNTIKRDVYVLRNTIKIPIEVTKGTDAISFEFTVRDYNLPATAAAVAYAYRMGMKKPNSTLCDVSGNVISFQPSANFFGVGNNELQIRVINEDKSLISFKERVKCSDAMGFPDDDAENQKTLVEQILAKTGQEAGERKTADEKEKQERIEAINTEKAGRIAGDAREKSERQAEIATERARINQFTKLAAGSTTGDAELIDGRTDVDGEVHENIGDAMRGQARKLREDLDSFIDFIDNLQYKSYDEIIMTDEYFIWNKPINSNVINIPVGKYIAYAKLKFEDIGENKITYYDCGLTLGYGLNDITFGNSLIGASNKFSESFELLSTFDITSEVNKRLYLRFNNVQPSEGSKSIKAYIYNTYLIKVDSLDEYDKYLSLFRYYGSLKKLPLNNIFEVNENRKDIEALSELVKTLEDYGSDKSIVLCYGDSLTMGAGGNGTTYPSVLQDLLGESYSVNNFGVGGETAQQIACRQGGVPMMVQPLECAYNQWVAIDFKSVFGFKPNYKFVYQSDAGFYPCTIDGKEINLYWDSDGNQIVRNRNTETLSVKRPTKIVPYSSTLRKKTCIIWCGTNGWGDNNIDTLINTQKRMVEYNGNDNYIVIGLHKDSLSDKFDELETKMSQAFGEHFINIREYLVNYGLEDAGITPTTDDETRISQGLVPSSLLSDGIHFNASGYTVIANVIHKKGKDLNIW